MTGSGHSQDHILPERRWYAVYTRPRHEKTVAKYLDCFRVHNFLPTYETEQRWRNRQKVTVALPLFPSYLFARIGVAEWRQVLNSSGVLRIIGSPDSPLAISESEIGFLRLGCGRRTIEPARFAIGQKVRIRAGALKGLDGVLTRMGNNLRFVLTVGMINQSASIEVSSSEIELLSPPRDRSRPPARLPSELSSQL